MAVDPQPRVGYHSKVAPVGIEPTTLGLVDRHSIHLSYEAISMTTPSLDFG